MITIIIAPHTKFIVEICCFWDWHAPRHDADVLVFICMQQVTSARWRFVQYANDASKSSFSLFLLFCNEMAAGNVSRNRNQMLGFEMTEKYNREYLRKEKKIMISIIIIFFVCFVQYIV